jgi:hypothetical protein
MLGLVKYLPIEIQFFCIIPYTYSKQSPELVCDIQTYTEDTNILDTIYGTQYNDVVLLRDLKNFCQLDDVYTDPLCLYVPDEVDINELPLCFAIWNRYCLYHGLANSEIYNHIRRFDNVDTHVRRKSMFIWGLLTRIERTMFINAYILDM